MQCRSPGPHCSDIRAVQLKASNWCGLGDKPSPGQSPCTEITGATQLLAGEVLLCAQTSALKQIGSFKAELERPVVETAANGFKTAVAFQN